MISQAELADMEEYSNFWSMHKQYNTRLSPPPPFREPGYKANATRASPIITYQITFKGELANFRYSCSLSSLWEVVLCFSLLWEVVLCFSLLWEVVLCFSLLWEVFLCFSLLWEVVLCFSLLWSLFFATMGSCSLFFITMGSCSLYWVAISLLQVAYHNFYFVGWLNNTSETQS